MISFASAARVTTLVAVTFAANSAGGREAIEAALGGPIVECSGAIAWTESLGGTQRVEPMRLAAPDVEGANAIALFLTEDDFNPNNIWNCTGGSCSATRALRSTVTVDALQLRHEADLGSGEAVYGMTAVYVLVNARETPIEVLQTRGVGSFICERPLSGRLLEGAE